MTLPAWASCRHGCGHGDGDNYGYGYGYGYNYGYGNGYGNGNGYSNGYGHVDGQGNGCGAQHDIEIGDEISIGCQRMTARDWLGRGMEIAAEHDYPAVAIPATRALVEALAGLADALGVAVPNVDADFDDEVGGR